MPLEHAEVVAAQPDARVPESLLQAASVYQSAQAEMERLRQRRSATQELAPIIGTTRDNALDLIGAASSARAAFRRELERSVAELKREGRSLSEILELVHELLRMARKPDQDNIHAGDLAFEVTHWVIQTFMTGASVSTPGATALGARTTVSRVRILPLKPPRGERTG